MDSKIVFLLVLLALTAECDDAKSSRTKRSKYYPSPPPGARVYRRNPPQPFYPKMTGYFSYTPPPNWMDDDQNPKPKPHVSKPQGLPDEDINNIIKYLSKQDLDKIIEFAGERERDRPVKERANHNSDRPDASLRDTREPQRVNEEKFSFSMDHNVPIEVQNNIGDSGRNRPSYTHPSQNQPPRDTRDSYNAYEDSNPNNYVGNFPQNLNADESVTQYQTVYLNGPYTHHINNEMKSIASQTVLFTESKDEDVLPKPLNLRQDYDTIVAQGTNSEATVAGQGYEVKNFGDLPLMEYLSKLDTVSSYHVPHYSITSQHPSNNKNGNNPHSLTPPPPQAVPSNPLNPSDAAKQQSDAHLKAIKIWTHKSKGAAYTLNDDGTLSVERPLRPKPVYGPYRR